MSGSSGSSPSASFANLEFLRKAAKAWLRACRAGDRASLDRLRQSLTHLERLDDTAIVGQVRLADVQHALARERGYSSWAALKRSDEPIERFLVTVRSGAANAAKRLLAESAGFAVESIHVACAIGDTAALGRHLERAPQVATIEHAGWTPIVYACASPLHKMSGRHSSGIFECVKLLLDHGVDPNSSTRMDPADPETEVPASYRAFMTLNMSVMALMKQRGATGTATAAVRQTMLGGERWHGEIGKLLRKPKIFAAFNQMQQEALKQKGKEAFLFLAPEDPRVFHRSRPRAWDENLNQIWRGMIDEGMDPNRVAVKDPLLHSLLHSGQTPFMAAIVEALLEEGADPDIEWTGGRNSLAVAIRTGNKPVADVLRAHGASASGLRLVDRLLGACRRLDEVEAGAIATAHPDIARRMRPDDVDVMVGAAARNNLDEVRLLARSGLDVGLVGEGGTTPLHAAAWHGHVEMVRLLIELGVPVNVRDRTYGTSPLAWAADGSTRCQDADDDYCAIVRALVDAGADRESAAGRSAETPGANASPRVATLLRSLLM